MPCEEIKATLKPVEPNIALVLDKSGSMVANPAGLWDHDADPNTPKITRWNSLYQVVQFIVTDYNDSINFGGTTLTEGGTVSAVKTGTVEMVSTRGPISTGCANPAPAMRCAASRASASHG